MPNVATVLRDEISRIAKKEAKRLVEPLRSQVQAHRHDIATLKKDRSALQAEVKRLTKAAARTQAATAAATASTEESGPRIRFGADQCKALRNRLGISQEALGLLVGVSGPSVFAWEAGKSKPRATTLARIADLRALGKREAAERIEALKTAKKPVKKAGAKKAKAKKARKSVRG